MELCKVPLSLPFCEPESVVLRHDSVEIRARVKLFPGVCPACRQLSERVHGYYVRTLLDLPVSGRPLRLLLKMCRFRCRNPACEQQTFTQQIHGFMQPYQRATRRLLTSLYHIGQALGGQAGARLAAKLAMPTSGDTLLQLLRRFPETPLDPVQVLGVDDWALRKGQRYGTILVDLERRQVIDLLPDRSAETLQAWLEKHPTVAVVTRDRSQEYAQGITAGAPAARQVADRWHLLKNTREALERALHENYACLKQAAASPKDPNEDAMGALRSTFPRGEAAKRVRDERRARRVKQYELVHYLRANGLSTRRIARLLGLSRGTVIRYARSEKFPERKPKRRQESILDPYLPYLEKRVQAGCQNSQQLWREIVVRGYPGSPSQVSKWMSWRRRQPSIRKTVESPPMRPVFLLPPAKEVAALLHLASEKLDEPDAWLLLHLRQIPIIAQLHDLVQSFFAMVREGLVENLDCWLNQCRNSELAAMQRFAAGLARDYAAVRAALESEWSNGQTEGQVNRLKLLKRQMYGRAKLDLLRKRMVYQP